ncbi:MAG: hypothetical protein IJW68_07380 [Bacteroidaceae bacterium]|nr:hypothetical protein [Bacteroidaceae bacterium]MBQ8736038.1 hypothetical protein [Bacteroidaceae bacterium]
MGYFKMPAPRRFNHKYIYVDERKEKLRKIEENALRELGMLPPEETSSEERIRGSFSKDTTHLKRFKEEGQRLSTKTIIIALAVSLFLLHYLLTGRWTF